MTELYPIGQLVTQQLGLYEGYARRYGLNARCLSILIWIYDCPDGITQNQISKKTHVSKQVVNATIKNFLKQELVYLEENLADKRHKKVQLTVEGRRFMNQILKPLEKAEQAVWSSLDQTERQLVLRLMQTCLQQLKQIVVGENE